MNRAFVLVAAALTAASFSQARPHGFDLVHVKWQVKLDEPDASLTGDCVNTLVAEAGVKEVKLDFGSLKVDSVSVNGKDAVFTHNGQALTITLPVAGDGKKSSDVRILYHGRPQSGAYFISASRAYPARTPVVYTQGEMVDNRYWLPTYDWPDDKATSEGIIIVPEGWYALSNGKLLSQKTAAGWTTFHWKMDTPHVTYLISFSAGPFDEGKSSWDGIPVNYYVPKGLKDQGEAAFGMTADIVRFYSQLTGFRYPYAKYTQSAVPDFMFGGMENITCTTQTIGTLHPKECGLTHDSTGLVAHELAHQWFGDTVTCSGWSDAWINEGWATFLPSFYVREKRGQDEYDLSRYDTFQGGLSAHRFNKSRPVVYAGYKDPLDMFDSFIYPGGASRMFMLMHSVGEKRFWEATRRYLEERKYTSFDTHAFFDSYSRFLGTDLKAFEQQWFFTPAAPSLTVSREGSTLVVTQPEPCFNLDAEVGLLEGGKWKKRAMRISGPRSTLDLGEDSVLPVLLDPEVWIMGDIHNQVKFSNSQIMAMFQNPPNAACQARMMDTMLGSLSAEEANSLARGIKAPAVLKRYVRFISDVPYLLEMAKAPDERAAQAALGRLGSLAAAPESLALVRDLAENSPNPALQGDAAQILLRWAGDDKMADEFWHRDGFGDRYRQMALDYWMGKNRDRAREMCLEAMAKGYPEPTRVSAIRYLGGLKDLPGERRVYDALALELKSRSFGGRTAAIQSLGQYGDKSAISLIEPFEHHELVFFRNTAAGVLAALRGK